MCFIVSCLFMHFYAQTDVTIAFSFGRYFICIQDDNDVLNMNDGGFSQHIIVNSLFLC